MAQWQKDKVDEFFGEDEAETFPIPKLESENGQGHSSTELDDVDDDDDEAAVEREFGELAVADSTATGERFRSIGYHEAYDESMEERLEEGFETGYRDAYDTSVRIGEMLGKATMQPKLLQQDNKSLIKKEKGSSDALPYQEALKLVRNTLTETDAAKNLQDLERQVKDVLDS